MNEETKALRKTYIGLDAAERNDFIKEFEKRARTAWIKLNAEYLDAEEGSIEETAACTLVTMFLDMYNRIDWKEVQAADPENQQSFIG